MMQTLIVAMLVIGSAAYAVWTLMPAAARRSLAGALLKLPLPDRWTATLRRASQAASGCGCDGCDHAPKAPADAAVVGQTATTVTRITSQPLVFHPRIRR
jgi:hypothetical protein